MTLCIALNYGGRAEIVDALNAILAERAESNRVHPNNGAFAPLTESQLSARLYTEGLPDPDLLIRTSGEMRVSNFLLWQIAYAEMFVTDTLWPDFSRARLLEALLEFQKRDRRYGGLSSSDSEAAAEAHATPAPAPPANNFLHQPSNFSRQRVAQIRLWFTNLGLSFEFLRPRLNQGLTPRFPPKNYQSSKNPTEKRGVCPIRAMGLLLHASTNHRTQKHFQRRLSQHAQRVM